MQIIAVQEGRAVAQYQGIERDIDLFLVAHEHIGIGDYVLVHVGYAIAKIDPREAEKNLALLSEIEME